MLISLTNSPGAAKHAGLFPAPVDAEFGPVYQLDFCLHDSGRRRSSALLDRHQLLSITFDVSNHWWFCYQNLSGPMEMKKKIDPDWAQRPGWIRPLGGAAGRLSDVERSGSSPRWSGNHLLHGELPDKPEINYEPTIGSDQPE